jgi:hypothetical protein
MKIKSLILIVIFYGILLFLLNGCSLSSAADGGAQGGNIDRSTYLITTDGNTNNLSQNTIDAEYDIFLFLPGETRKLYFGGRLPQSYYDYNTVWLENSTIWNSIYSIALYSTDVNEIQNNNYYSILAAPIDIPYNSKVDYNVKVHVGNVNNNLYTSYANKDVIFKIGDYGDRDWNIDVYQQQSYNSTAFAKDAIVKAFKEMNVSVTMNIINSDLSDEIVDMDNSQSVFANNPIIQYVYSKIYPTLNTAEAIAKYSVDHPNSGLLFFIQDYNITGGAAESLYGKTYAAYTNGDSKYPAVSFVFVKKLLDNYSADWENKSVTATAIHELGHLWCIDLTDDATHHFWHNGDNKNQCVMDRYNLLTSGEPDDPTKKIFNFAGFCEGHLQRGMNVSWKLKQYTPYKEISGTNQQRLFASNNADIIYSDINNGNNNFDLTIESARSEFIMGEIPDVIISIKNKSNDTLKLDKFQQYIYSYDENRTIEGYKTDGMPYTILPPHQQYSFFINPMAFINHKNEGNTPAIPWFYWYEGKYDFYISYRNNGDTYFSNKILLTIDSLPDSLKEAFENLKYNINITRPSGYYRMLADKYKGTFYEQQFYYKLFVSPEYREMNDTQQLEVKQYIINYCNTESAYQFFHSLLIRYDKYQNLIKDILLELKKEKPDCAILKVLRTQPDYNYKQIKSLLQKEEE